MSYDEGQVYCSCPIDQTLCRCIGSTSHNFLCQQGHQWDVDANGNFSGPLSAPFSSGDFKPVRKNPIAVGPLPPGVLE